MKIIKSHLIQLIKEELQSVTEAGGLEDIPYREATPARPVQTMTHEPVRSVSITPEFVTTINTAADAMREAADEIEWGHVKTHDKYLGYEPPSPEIVHTLRNSADQLEELVQQPGEAQSENY